jgi:hypothetical protein
VNQETFEDALRSFLRREPFLPFVVELASGEQITVEEPTVAFNGGAAGYLSPSYDLKEFACENVRDIRLAAQEPAS